jgi:acyl-coenzyme A thioesterase PaaI-like protein
MAEINLKTLLWNAEPGWEKLENFDLIGGKRPFIMSEQNNHILCVSYFQRKEDGALAGKIWFGPGAEGPPNHAHGGSIAAVFDEIMGASVWFAGYVVLAARVSVDFLKPIPLNLICHYEARIEQVIGKKIFAKGRIHSLSNQTYAEAEGIFVLVDPEKLIGMKNDSKNSSKI